MRRLHRLALFLSAAALAAGLVTPAPAAEATSRPLVRCRIDKAVYPEQAARCVYRAWRQGSRKLALKKATQAAVNQLFAIRPRRMYQAECAPTGAAAFECHYNGAHNVLFLTVQGGASAGYVVTAAGMGSAG